MDVHMQQDLAVTGSPCFQRHSISVVPRGSCSHLHPCCLIRHGCECQTCTGCFRGRCLRCWLKGPAHSQCSWPPGREGCPLGSSSNPAAGFLRIHATSPLSTSDLKACARPGLSWRLRAWVTSSGDDQRRRRPSFSAWTRCRKLRRVARLGGRDPAQCGQLGRVC